MIPARRRVATAHVALLAFALGCGKAVSSLESSSDASAANDAIQSEDAHGGTESAADALYDADGDATNDAGLYVVDATLDAAPDVMDAALDTALDVSPDAPCEAPDGYHDITQACLWSVFDTASLDASMAAPAFAGATFDGRFLYIVSAGNINGYGGGVARFDTQGDFTSTRSWNVFNASSVDSRAKGYSGAVFDGRFVYLVPYYYANVAHGIVARYDTQASFSATSAWSIFDAASLDPNAVGFSGGAFDGRYLYLAPTGSGLVTRYDTQGSFGTASSWATFDTITLDPSALNFVGAVFDGRNVYFVPEAVLPANGKAIVVQYDSQASFGSAGAWSSFDSNVLNTKLDEWGFEGAAFDGRYVYLAPKAGSGVPRFDIQGTLADAASWSMSDTGDGGVGAYFGTAFDGRYVYFVPGLYNFGPCCIVSRVDTLADFTVASSWSTFPLGTLVPATETFRGAAFDGRYVYLVPNGSVVVRFDARTPPVMPSLPAFHGSFY